MSILVVSFNKADCVYRRNSSYCELDCYHYYMGSPSCVSMLFIFLLSFHISCVFIDPFLAEEYADLIESVMEGLKKRHITAVEVANALAAENSTKSRVPKKGMSTLFGVCSDTPFFPSPYTSEYSTKDRGPKKRTFRSFSKCTPPYFTNFHHCLNSPNYTPFPLHHIPQSPQLRIKYQRREFTPLHLQNNKQPISERCLVSWIHTGFF